LIGTETVLEQPSWIAQTRARAGQRSWHLLALSVAMGVAALFNIVQLSREAFGNTYYAATVKSMLTSWHNFFFVSFDAGGFVSADKPPLGLWIQAVSAKLFGFNGLSLLLPQALAGVAAVAVLYHLVARRYGWVAGFLAALALAVTPISVVTERNNTSDGVLVFVLLCAAWAVMVAAESGRLGPLLLGATLVGLGFNIKMLQAYLVVPAFALLWLVGTSLPWRKRLLHLLVAGGVLLAVSLAWVVTVDLTPASARPYVGSSGTNSALSLTLGYNGLSRLTDAFFTRFPGLRFFHIPVDLNVAPAMSPGIGEP
jgi:4-amino-4-deoxy-L-arabinose transferase-like glycosyltransferase